MAGQRRLILHAGTHKTGTTAIQRTLGSQAALLRQQGVYWPLLHENQAHHLIARSVNDEVRWAALQRWLLRQRLRHAARRCRTVVLSSEKVYRYGFEFFEGVSQEGEKPLVRRHNFLHRLSRLLDGFDMTVLLYLRRVDEFAESLFKEQQFRKKYTGSYRFETFIEEQGVLFDYAMRVREFEEFLGPVLLCSYHEASRSGLIEHFCAQIGVSLPPAAVPPTRLRESPSNRASQVLMAWSAREEVPVETRREFHAFALSPQWREPEGSRPSLWGSEAAQRAFLETYATPGYAHLFPPVDWSGMSFAPLSEAEFARYRAEFEVWRRSATHPAKFLEAKDGGS